MRSCSAIKQIVNAGDAQAHQAVGVELPVLVAMAAKPLAAVIVPFIGEPHRDAVLAKGPELLDQLSNGGGQSNL